MTESTAVNKETINLKDYQPPLYHIKGVDLHISIAETKARIVATSSIVRNRARLGEVGGENSALLLDGEAVDLVSVSVDGVLLEENDFQLTEKHLLIPKVPNEFSLVIVTELQPALNTSLMGMYKSSGNICTQCEAEGFRKITFFLDRPDNMSLFTTTIVADKKQYPILLSNGNLVERTELEGGLHQVKWLDPHPKPSYLFALVAGDLAQVSDEFVTMSGRHVALNIYVQHHNAAQCGHALLALKNAMRWDEEVYGREYDLDVHNIVAVDDFNMGAMENKGLNIFNSKYVLANKDTATDADYQVIEGIIGHEYFHNWSGNRVTCRDWFQLSLKEGFTVFRDQEFSADMASRAVNRIQDVNVLRTVQFREDASPVAHPVRPESYMEINNFYTATVYNKGAEVVRMLHNLLGKEKFREGTDLYFSRHDGQAATVDDFVQAMEDVANTDFKQFKRWYSQAGTPVVKVDSDYDANNATYTLRIEQTCPVTPESAEKLPFLIPIAIALFYQSGEKVPLKLASRDALTSNVLAIREAKETFVFQGVQARPVASLLRGFSAPVKLEADVTLDDQYFLMAHDDDSFNRWNANQDLAIRIILENIDRGRQQQAMEVDRAYLLALGKTLEEDNSDKSFLSLLLTLPTEQYIAENMSPVEPILIHQASRFVKRSIASHCEDKLLALYRANNDVESYAITEQGIGRRRLKNLCLSYLSELDKQAYRDLAWLQFSHDNNMTDVLAAFQCLVQSGHELGEKATQRFYEKWQDDALVLDKWFSAQAVSPLPGGIERVRRLMDHEQFNIKNPNKVRALIGVFSQLNMVNFHQEDGAGYEFLGDCIVELDEINPQVAARLLGGLGVWTRYDERRQLLMKSQLERVLNRPQISRDCYDVVQRLLA